MKIVLRQDVPKLGEAGSIQTVANGYARNFLIPQGMAVVATDAEIKVATHNLAVKERKTIRQEEQLRSYSDKIQGQRLVFTAKAGDQGRLYGSITAADIARELAAKIGEDVDRRRIQLDEPLRSLGEHPITIHVVGRLRPQVTVVVEEEKEAEEASPVEAADAATEAAAEEVEVEA
jgi:large subunit ribosomal protein L9